MLALLGDVFAEAADAGDLAAVVAPLYRMPADQARTAIAGNDALFVVVRRILPARVDIDFLRHACPVVRADEQVEPVVAEHLPCIALADAQQLVAAVFDIAAQIQHHRDQIGNLDHFQQLRFQRLA